jgi:hypothetical protein
VNTKWLFYLLFWPPNTTTPWCLPNTAKYHHKALAHTPIRSQATDFDSVAMGENSTTGKHRTKRPDFRANAKKRKQEADKAQEKKEGVTYASVRKAKLAKIEATGAQPGERKFDNQVDGGERAVNTQETFREHSECTQGIIQGTFRDSRVYRVLSFVGCPGCYKLASFVNYEGCFLC